MDLDNSQLVSNPSIAYLALIVGLFMLFVAVTTPGTGVAEVIAFIALAIAAIGFDQLVGQLFGRAVHRRELVLFVIDATATAAR
ncbi:MAG: hypothetical protein U0559_04865 [Anaerolineae bacterium]